MNRKNIQCKDISSTVSSEEGSFEENEQSNREYVASASSTPSHEDVDQVADDREYIERNSTNSSDMSFHKDGEEAKENEECWMFHSHDSDDNAHYEEDVDAKTLVDDVDDVDTDRNTSSSSSPDIDFVAAAQRFDNPHHDSDHLTKWLEEKMINEGRYSGSDRDTNVHINVESEAVIVDVDVEALYDNVGGKEDDEYGERDISSSPGTYIDVGLEEESTDRDLIDPDKVINWLKQNDDIVNKEYRDRSPLKFSDRKLDEEDDEDY